MCIKAADVSIPSSRVITRTTVKIIRTIINIMTAMIVGNTGITVVGVPMQVTTIEGVDMHRPTRDNRSKMDKQIRRIIITEINR